MMHRDIGWHFLQAVSSFVFFEWFTGFASPQIASHLPPFNSLSSIKKAEFHSRLGSTLHAIIVSAIGIYILLTDEDSKKDHVWGDSWLARTNLAISVGYLLSDLRFILKDVENSGGGWGYVFHHLSAIWPYTVVILISCLCYFANFRLIAEISTPFVNNRWYYDVTGRKDSQIYFYNGLILAATFFFFRIAVMPYYYYLVYCVFITEEYTRLGCFIQVSWILPCIVLDTLNIQWFYKILRGAQRVLKKRNSAMLSNGNGISHASTVTENNNHHEDDKRIKAE